ncbi:MAG: CRISPR-associated helicase Cas3', partial [Candidatus Stygibacter australis]|nr:CRISPR-associated helicase Cas3' [Candidatus Stygibacter australis]
FNGNLEEEEDDIFSYINDRRDKDFDKFNPDIPLNKLRNRFLEEIYNNAAIRPENHFYSITSPTGIGKTFGCMVFANKLRKLLPERNARIIYCLPYTSIIDQNYKEFDKILSFSKGDKYQRRPNRYLLKHHYQNPKIINNRLDEDKKTLKDYHDDVLFVESWKSTYVVTTFVQLFYAVIGYRNRSLKKFHNIVNSIIILDEVQNIDPDYYRLLRETFQVLGKKFGIYFLLITATQPEIIEKEDIVELTNSEFYMHSEIFNRVSLTRLNDVNDIDELIDDFGNLFLGNNALIVMNTKKMAKYMYEQLRELHSDYTLIYLTTNLLPYDRIIKIDQVRELLRTKEKVIVVSTQLIEAGVDLSFEYVFRDFGPLDSIVQVAGRCNRNGEYGLGNGKMFLFDLNNSNIYKKFVIQSVRDILSEQEYLSKDFYKLSIEYFSKLKFSSESKKIIKAIKELNYDTEIREQTPVNKFKLINDEGKESIYILRTKDAQKNMDELICQKRKLLKEPDRKIKDQIQLKIEKLKYELLPFTISLYPQELEIYRHYLQPAEEIDSNPDYPIKYLSYKFQAKYAYDEDIGFLKIPKKEIVNLQMW